MPLTPIRAPWGTGRQMYGSVSLTYPLGPAIITQPLPQDRPKPEPVVELQEAETFWGGPSNFGWQPAPTQTFSLSVKDPDDKEEEEEEKNEIELKEQPEHRRFETIKIPVEPGTEEVEVTRITAIALLGPDRYGEGAVETLHKITFDHSTMPK